MQRDTYILAGATLVPFLVAFAVVVELRRKPAKMTDPRD
jgi:hypothetical protein